MSSFPATRARTAVAASAAHAMRFIVQPLFCLVTCCHCHSCFRPKILIEPEVRRAGVPGPRRAVSTSVAGPRLAAAVTEVLLKPGLAALTAGIGEVEAVNGRTE